MNCTVRFIYGLQKHCLEQQCVIDSLGKALVAWGQMLPAMRLDSEHSVIAACWLVVLTLVVRQA
jgi:hypothetical protein